MFSSPKTRSTWTALLAAGALLTGCAKQTAEPSPTPALQAKTSEASMNYPKTTRQEIEETLHGTTVEDPYRWLEDVDDEEVQAWMRAQNEFTRTHLDTIPGREWLTKRFTELYYIEAVGTPTRRGDRYFLHRRSAEQEKYVVYWKDGEEGEEHVLLNPNELSEDGSISLGGVFPSKDGSKVAYKLKENNADEATLYVMEVDSGVTSEIDVIPGAKYAWPSWTPDNEGFYYTWLPTDPDIPVMERPGYAEVRYHAIGTDPSDDPQIVAPTNDPQTFVGADVSHGGDYLFRFTHHGWNSTDLYWRPRASDDDTWTPLAVGKDAKFHDVIVHEGTLFLHTNWEAPNWRVLALSMEDPSLEEATTVVEPREDAVLRDVQLIGGKLILHYMEKAHSVLQVHDLDGSYVRTIEFPTIGSSGGLSGERDSPEAFYTFTSFTVPNQIYKTNVETGTSELWASIDVPVDPSPYEVEQVTYTSKDGTEVTMFLVHKKGLERDGSTPFLLNGYGGFNVSMTPSFRASIYPWLEMGGGFAVANLRGGGEYGEEWHEAGMLEHKQNVFNDFIAAAEYLIDEGYTNPDKLAIRGGSNGGLLVGAAMTQRPDLFEAVVCAVPLLDMVRYHLFGSGKTWIPEYGSAEDPEQFKYIYAYSPYHHVEEGQDYPATLLLSADSDDRVDPMHARKFAAALQHADGDGEPILLRIETNAGHGGGDMVSKAVTVDVDTYAFLMQALQVSAPTESPAK